MIQKNKGYKNHEQKTEGINVVYKNTMSVLKW